MIQSLDESSSQVPQLSVVAVELHTLSQPLSTELPPHTPAQSSTAVELHTLSQPLSTELPPHTPAQSCVQSFKLSLSQVPQLSAKADP